MSLPENSGIEIEFSISYNQSPGGAVPIAVPIQGCAGMRWGTDLPPGKHAETGASDTKKIVSRVNISRTLIIEETKAVPTLVYPKFYGV